MFSFFLGLGRIPMMIIAGMAIISAFYGWLLVHDHNLKNEIIAEFNQQQEQILAEKQKEFLSQMQELQKRNDALLLSAREQNTQVDNKMVEIERQINTGDRSSEAPKYFKELMIQLDKNFGEKK
jgi:cell division protein FtsN